MLKTTTTNNNQNKKNQKNFNELIEKLKKIKEENPESLNDEQKMILEQDEINKEWEGIDKEWKEINKEWEEILKEKEEILKENQELIKDKEEIINWCKEIIELEKSNKNSKNFDWFDELHKDIYKAQDEFNNVIEFIQKNKEVLTDKWIEIPNRILKHFKSLETYERRSYYRIWIIWWSDKTNKVFNNWKKNRQGCFWIQSNQLELLWDYKKQQDIKFAKQINDDLLYDKLNFIIFLQSDHETKLIELEKDFPNRVTILWRIWISNNDSNIQRFSNWRFLHYLEQALEKYENKENN